jgi:hypothetical protein
MGVPWKFGRIMVEFDFFFLKSLMSSIPSSLSLDEKF